MIFNRKSYSEYENYLIKSFIQAYFCLYKTNRYIFAEYNSKI